MISMPNKAENVGGEVRGLHSAAHRQKIAKSAACGFQGFDSTVAASSRQQNCYLY